MAVIDADAHVVETERTWEYMEEAESPFRPEVVEDGKIDPATADKFLDSNPKRLYGLQPCERRLRNQHPAGGLCYDSVPHTSTGTANSREERGWTLSRSWIR